MFDILFVLVIAYAAPASLKVVDEPTIHDTTSWEYISQQAPLKDLLDFLKTSPELHAVNLSKYVRKVNFLDLRYVVAHSSECFSS